MRIEKQSHIPTSPFNLMTSHNMNDSVLQSHCMRREAQLRNQYPKRVVLLGLVIAWTVRS